MQTTNNKVAVTANSVTMTFLSGMTKVLPYDKIGTKEIFGLLAYGDETSVILNIKSNEILIDGELKVLCSDKAFKAEIYRIAYVPSVLAARCDHDDYVICDKAGLYPDRIEKICAKAVRIVPQVNNQFFIKIKCANVSCKKRFTISAVFSNSGKKEGYKSIIVDYVPLKLEESKIVYTNWLHCDSLAVAHNVKPFGKEFYKILGSYVSFAVKSGVNMLMVPLITPPLDTYYKGHRKNVQLIDISVKNGGYVFGFEKLDKFIDFITGFGIKKYEFPPLFSQWDAKYAASVIIKENGETKRFFGWNTLSDDEKYLNFIGLMLSALREHLESKGILQNCYFHICDEAHDKCGLYTRLRAAVTENISGGKFIDTSVSYSQQAQNDPEICDVLSLSQADEAIKSGCYPVAIYYCWSDYKNYISNRFFCMSLSRTAVIWLQAYLNDCRLLLHWGFNFYQDFLSHYYLDPNGVTDLGGVFPSGDGFVVYPAVAEKSADSSLRLEAIAGGFKLYRLVLTHEKVFGAEKTKRILRESGMSGYGCYPHNDEWLINLESLLIGRLSKV